MSANKDQAVDATLPTTAPEMAAALANLTHLLAKSQEEVTRLERDNANIRRAYGEIVGRRTDGTPGYRRSNDDAEIADTFQARVKPWMQTCFGETKSRELPEQRYRFATKALELVQSLGCTSEEAFTLVGSVFERPTDAVAQEVGGVMVTLAALCLATDVEMFKAGEAELARSLDENRRNPRQTSYHTRPLATFGSYRPVDQQRRSKKANGI